jgi:hypothetical protein
MTARFKKWLILRALLLLSLLCVPQLAIAEPPSLATLIRGIEAKPEAVYVDFKPLAEKAFDPSWCNCYAYIERHYADLPSSATVRANATAPAAPHTVAVFYYAEVGLYHYAYVTAVSDTDIYIDEANYVSCVQGRRIVPKNDPSLLGFFQL